VQRYNAQAAVNEQQIVVAAEITNSSTDFSQLDPMVTATLTELEKAGIPQRPEVIVADAGYWNEQPITDAEVEALAAEAEAGYDVDELLARRPKRGRPALGSSPASVESVRLDPELRRELLERARADGTTTSEVIREALRRFLHAASAAARLPPRSRRRLAQSVQ
jgi:uncharacterized protein (DUF4415 family)